MSSQDNLKAVAGNTAPPATMIIPAPFTPPWMKAGIGAIIKAGLMVLTKEKKEETQMDVDLPGPSINTDTLPMSTTVQASPLKTGYPAIVIEEGMKKWTNDMLGGQLGRNAVKLNAWGNYVALEFKTVIATFSRSLTIKENSYNRCSLRNIMP